MWRILIESTQFITGVIVDTLKMLFENVFYTNGRLNFFGWFFFVYMSIALLSAIIDPLIDYFSGTIRTIGTNVLSKFNVEVDENGES